MYPTPTANDAKNTAGAGQARRHTPPLNLLAGGKLNPLWVEWLMGWPLGWTDLGASVTVKFLPWRLSRFYTLPTELDGYIETPTTFCSGASDAKTPQSGAGSGAKPHQAVV
jgi:hypothetical protein